MCAGFIWGLQGNFSNSEINDLKLSVCCLFQLSGAPIEHALGSVCSFCMETRCTVYLVASHG